MKNTRRILLIFVIFFLGLLGYFFWQGGFWYAESDDYRTEKVRIGNISQIVSANGTLNPITLVNVGTQITGKVEKIYADFNDHVKAGQILLELDSSLLRTEVERGLANLKKAEANLDFAKANIKRGRVLYRDKFISKQDWEELLREERAAISDLKSAKAELNRSRTNLNYATIRSPVSGVVVDRQVDVGQTVTASFQTPILFQIAQDLNKMQIDTSFAEADIGNIKSGQKAVFTVDAFPNREFVGSVKQIRLAPSVEQNVVTYNVVIIVENKDAVLLPGMTAYVNIKTIEYKNVMLVPNAALRFKPRNGRIKNGKKTSQEGILYKLDGDILEQVRCRISVSDNSFTEIISDKIKSGDLVVLGYEKGSKGKNSFRVKVF